MVSQLQNSPFSQGLPGEDPVPSSSGYGLDTNAEVLGHEAARLSMEPARTVGRSARALKVVSPGSQGAWGSAAHWAPYYVGRRVPVWAKCRQKHANQPRP